MTKINSKYLIVIAIFAIVLLVSSRIYIDGIITKTNYTFKDYNARKDDLIAKQKLLEKQMNDLNKTLISELSRQEELSKKLNEIKVQTSNITTSSGTTTTTTNSGSTQNNQQSQTTTNPVVTTPAPVQTPASVPTPTPTPTPTPVTRAS